MNHYSFFPFVGGVRKCIGAAFASFETKIVFAHVSVADGAETPDSRFPLRRRSSVGEHVCVQPLCSGQRLRRNHGWSPFEGLARCRRLPLATKRAVARESPTSETIRVDRVLEHGMSPGAPSIAPARDPTDDLNDEPGQLELGLA